MRAAARRVIRPSAAVLRRTGDGPDARLARALVALAQEPDRRRDDLATVLGAAPDGLARVVIDHGVAGVAHAHARELRASFPDLVAELDTARRDAWANHRTTLADLREVAAVLDGLGAPWAVVKGPVLVERAYGRADLRDYYDLDLLVHPAWYGAALAALEAAGVVLLDRNWELIRASARAELSLRVHERTFLDLHWHLVNEAPLRRRTSWDMAAVLGRATVVDLGGVPAPVLEPVDALVHVAVHACLSGGHRLVWLKDIERLWAAFPVPVAAVEERARAARLWPQASLALLRAARTFDLVPPPHPPVWTRLNRCLGAGEFTVGSGLAGSGRTLGSATRDTLPRSVAAVAGAVLAHAVVRPARAHGLGRWLPPAPPTLDDLRRPSGSDEDRTAYLRMVAAAGRR